MESKNKNAPAKLHIRKGDTVKVISGNAKGETGVIKTCLLRNQEQLWKVLI